MRSFSSGATRDESNNKPDYEGFYSPLVIKRFGEYMQKHRVQVDGKLRASDNWQRGIPHEEYLKSLLRHVLDAWLIHDGYADEATTDDMTEALCAVLFNAQGLLFERLKERRSGSW